MGKKVKKKARAAPQKDKWIAADSPKKAPQPSNPSVKNGDDAVSVPKEKKPCPHVDKGVDLNKLSAKIGSSEVVRCEDCREGAVDRRGGKGKGKHGKKKGSASVDSKSESKAIWVCLECGHYSCGGVGLPTTPQCHALRHARQTRHPLVIHFENPQLRWCFSCSMLIKIDKMEENSEQKDVFSDVGKLIKGHSSEESSVNVEDVWFGNGSVTSDIKSANNISSDLDGRIGYMVRGSEEMMRETETVDSEMDYLTKDVQVAVTGISATASAHDQPLSLCIDEMHSIKAIECSSNPAGTAKQQNEDGGTQVGQPHLPFVRSSPLWENIESMDVFKRFPQMPHFHPLLKCKEVCREGLALGKMVNFAFLVEKTSKLQVGDPRDLFDSILEALADLEMLGFDVTAVRHRLKELLEMKVKLGQLQNRSQEVDIQITACAHDRTRNNETISRIDKDIKDLQEKRATLMSIGVAKGYEISKLQSEANAIAKGIQSIHCDFEKLAAAAW